MPPFGSRDDSSLVDELLQQGLTFFAANRVEQAVARWLQVLELVPGEPRALDYLASAGRPFAEGTGQSGLPVGPHTQAPDSAEIEVFEVAPISHRSDWPRATSMAPARAAPSRASVMAPWLLIAVLLPVVGYLVFAQLGGGAELPGREAAGSVAQAQPAEAAPAASQPAAPSVAPAPEPPAVAPAVEPAAAPASAADDTYVVTLSVVPSSAIIKMDGQQVARGEYIARLERDGVAHTVEISAPRYQTRELTFVDQPPPERVRLQLDRAARRARRAQREAERDKQRAREREKDGEKAREEGGEKEREKGGEEAERAQTEPRSPPPPAAPVRKSDNINPWASPR